MTMNRLRRERSVAKGSVRSRDVSAGRGIGHSSRKNGNHSGFPKRRRREKSTLRVIGVTIELRFGHMGDPPISRHLRPALARIIHGNPAETKEVTEPRTICKWQWSFGDMTPCSRERFFRQARKADDGDAEGFAEEA
jgi:hypothetical protein